MSRLQGSWRRPNKKCWRRIHTKQVDLNNYWWHTIMPFITSLTNGSNQMTILTGVESHIDIFNNPYYIKTRSCHFRYSIHLNSQTTFHPVTKLNVRMLSLQIHHFLSHRKSNPLHWRSNPTYVNSISYKNTENKRYYFIFDCYIMDLWHFLFISTIIFFSKKMHAINLRVLFKILTRNNATWHRLTYYHPTKYNDKIESSKQKIKGYKIDNYVNKTNTYVLIN